jgi:hypothetical protein
MDNKIILFENSDFSYSSFIDYIVYDYSHNHIEVSIKGKVYIYHNVSYNSISDIVNCIKQYGAGKAYNWLIKNKNFTRV